MWRAFSLLNSGARKKLISLTIIQIATGILDLFGVAAIGALGALSIQGIESKSPGNKVGVFLRLIGLENRSLQSQVTIIGIFAAVILSIRTLISVIFTRRTFFFLSEQGAELSAGMLSKYLSKNILFSQGRTTQEILFISSEGFRNIMVGILATFVTMASDASMLLILAFGLFLIDPIIALSTIVLFIGLAIVLHRLLQVRAQEIGREEYKYSVLNNQKILEVLNTFRESFVKARHGYYISEINLLRQKLGNLNAEMNFQPLISKYIIESSTVLGSLLLAGYEFETKTAVHAVATLAVFMAASMRIAPGALRIQQGFLAIKNASGAAESTFKLLDELSDAEPNIYDVSNPDFTYSGFVPELQIKSINFKYPNNNRFTISDLTLSVPAGSSLAIVGPTGSGKTTLIDLILGVLEPLDGTIHISGLSPLDAIKKWPGAISYVPQDIFLSSATIKENITLGYKYSDSFEKQVWAALETAQLLPTIVGLTEKLDSTVGENGGKLSGGQRQRLGIARALFTKPKLLVLDEATSALDGKTEYELANALSNLDAGITVIVVAHRLSTVKNVDQLIYIENGIIIAKGTFEEVRKAVPNFDEQASLMGL